MTIVETPPTTSTVELDPTVYPESDGEPMAENTEQFRWIVTIKENLEALFAADANVFVAGDLLWYPVQFQPTTRRAPDVMVVIGRPKGDRGAYLQWLEGNLPPQVVFEILSPGNHPKEMLDKFVFYQQYGVEEYYLYDPEDNDLLGYTRSENQLVPIAVMNGYTSPRLQIRFVLTDTTLEIYRPDGQRFLTFVELEQKARHAEAEAVRARAEAVRARAEAEAERARAEAATDQAATAIAEAKAERTRAEAAEARATQLAARLRELGIEV